MLVEEFAEAKGGELGGGVEELGLCGRFEEGFDHAMRLFVDFLLDKVDPVDDGNAEFKGKGAVVTEKLGKIWGCGGIFGGGEDRRTRLRQRHPRSLRSLRCGRQQLHTHFLLDFGGENGEDADDKGGGHVFFQEAGDQE